MVTREVEAMYFFAKYSFDLSYIFIKKNPIFLYNFCQNWLDTALNDYLLPIQMAFFQDFLYRLETQSITQ